MDIDLLKPVFTHVDAIAITGVTGKTLQNWAQRDIIKLGTQNPGRQGKRLYRPVDLIVIKFLNDAREQGLAVSEAASFSHELVNRALDFWDTSLLRFDEGPPKIVFDGSNWDKYSKAVTYLDEQGQRCFRALPPTDGDTSQADRLAVIDTFGPHVYLVIQTDVLIAVTINKIIDYLSGPTAPGRLSNA